jgi:hypothetical protein
LLIYAEALTTSSKMSRLLCDWLVSLNEDKLLPASLLFCMTCYPTRSLPELVWPASPVACGRRGCLPCRRYLSASDALTRRPSASSSPTQHEEL